MHSVENRPLGIAMIGNGFMAKAHTKAIVDANLLRPARPVALISISGREESALAASVAQYGWQDFTTDWRDQVADSRVDIVDNTGPNALHLQPMLAAARAGKHVICEKPLATNADDAFLMWQAAAAAGISHLCAFNFRFAPAVRLAHQMVKAGDIGEVLHVRAQFLESSALDRRAMTWRDNVTQAGSGALGDLGSHIIDLTRFVAGDYDAVQATTRTVVPTRAGQPVLVDDAFGVLVQLASGATGVLEGSRVAGGCGTRCAFEVDGTKGSLRFTSERLNDLDYVPRDRVVRTIRAVRADHPFMELWWPDPGHPIGWGDTFMHEVAHFLDAVAGEHGVTPLAADFEDGYRCAAICDAILRAAVTGEREPIAYRSLSAQPAR